ncbi:hypothetical protein JQ628_11215 [Bradyrhizobium lablabi]|uniref:hypothetical protein n=1 Tax=Bradyrhizobium lablabi TaxID=722472 RepID=UPI001BA6348A|nr:hypothetical protein [Bradyrhizobium lablabi]MBR1122085.1 hypothetical protein [Bradyrhizobium lablabi]
MSETIDREDTSIGGVTWHCSDEDSGPDVGISVYLGPDDRLWCGEVSRQLFDGADGQKHYRDDYGWFIVRYRGKETILLAKCAGEEAAREFIEQIGIWVRAAA